MWKILSKLWKEWKEEWPKYVLEILIIVIIGGLIFWGITESLKPQTDISVDCKISKGTITNYTLDISFYNKADFAGKKFYMYIWGVTSSSWGSNYAVSEHCRRIEELEVDYRNRFKLFCDFIPPQSKFGFSIYTDLNEDIINTKRIKIEWWGETTPYKEESVLCD
jgi:hypothetical protein